ncbi:MAG: hypothetical protein ACR2OU_18720 [Thermomicrobiales bacterium]
MLTYGHAAPHNDFDRDLADYADLGPDDCDVDFPLWMCEAPEPEDDDQPNDDDRDPSQPPY